MIDYWIYIAVLLLVVVAAFIIKKVASCMLKILILITFLAALCFGYFWFQS